MEKTTFNANGKLLLTAEYFVLDGAKALALPTKFGQSLSVELSPSANGFWKSYDADGSLWFEAELSILNYEILKTSDTATAATLAKILKACRALKAAPMEDYKPIVIETRLTFPRNWGLGTSSTLIHNLANLFKINEFQLLERTFGGSGYDLACASARQPILFWRDDNRQPFSEKTDFAPPFADSLYFVFLGKKQNSRDGIKRYRSIQNPETPQYIEQFSTLTEAFLTCQNLANFEHLIFEHEKLIASVLDLPRAKDLHFSDYWGEIKSLGAWGGDFVLATSDRNLDETKNYFNQHGFQTILRYSEMVL